MSYARFGEDSDVYVYLDVNGFLNCCFCSFVRDTEGQFFYTTKEMLTHLKKHQARGDKVPEYSIESLKTTAVENDKWIKETKRTKP